MKIQKARAENIAKFPLTAEIWDKYYGEKFHCAYMVWYQAKESLRNACGGYGIEALRKKADEAFTKMLHAKRVWYSW